MSKGLGRIERWIDDEIARDKERGAVLVHSWGLVSEYKDPNNWEQWKPSQAQSKAVVRAMHSYVRKHPQFALMGGKGRGNLYLYEPNDPLSAEWARMSVDPKRKGFISRLHAKASLEARTNTTLP